MESQKSYSDKINEESRFWGHFENHANNFGVPWWCDLRRATKLSKRVCGWMYDPKIETILRGACKTKLINIASAEKGNALDLGCGAGWLSLELARRGVQVDAFDISDTRIEIAKKYLKKNPYKRKFGSVNYEVKDLNRISLEKDKYSSIVCWDSLHHIPKIAELAAELHQSLRPGGYLIIYDHIGLNQSNYRFIDLWLMSLRFLSRIKKLIISDDLRGSADNNSGQADHRAVSPFEDVTGNQIIAVVKKHFRITSLETKLCFAARLANEFLEMPGSLTYHVIRLLKIIDHLLIKTHLLRGEYVFLIARKDSKI